MTTNQLYKALYACQSARCWNPRIIGIRHESDCLIATEGHVLAVVPFDTPPEKVGKTIKPDGSINPELYPLWRNVVPSDPRSQEDINFKRVLTACAALSEFTYLNIGGVILNHVFVRKAAVLLKLFGDAGTVEIYRTCVVFRCADAYVLIMGRVGSEGLSIEEACELSI